MKIMIGILLLTMVVLSGCVDGSRAEQVSNHPEKHVIKDKKAVKNNTIEIRKEVQLDHIKIKVSSNWGVTKGLDSASFSINGKPAGGIDGLAYAESLDVLLPNQSIVKDKQKLNQLPFAAYQVTTISDAVQSKTIKETHIYIFVEPKKEVYDLHFEANAMDDKTILQILLSAVIIDNQ